MTAYAPLEPGSVLLLVALLGIVLLCGYGLARWRSIRKARIAAWALVVVATAAAERISAHEHAGFRMIAIVLALLYAMKAIAAVEAAARGESPLSFARWLCFAVGWFGMRPSLFAALGGPPLPGAWALVRAGITRFACGVILVFSSWVVWRSPLSAGHESWLRIVLTFPLMAGLSLILHFGLFNILTGLWRAAGVDAEPLFRAPFASRTLAEFWSRRWNIGFSEMTSFAVYQPLRRKVGAPNALAVSFAFSGAMHEIAISLPVKQGFGGPLVYFLIQGASLLLQRRLRTARLWTLATLLLPLPLLFHTPFLDGLIWPLIGMQK